ncbi:MAG: TIM barrel protein [Planctomycetota bacterium]|nr:TIM barrel protein [Planctomycetota bacterium]
MDLFEAGSSTPGLSATFAPLPTAPRRAFDRLREMGFGHVQLSAAQPGLRPRELDRSARRDLLATLRRRELAVSGLDVWIGPGEFLDPAKMDRAVGAMIEAIELAADLGRCPVSLTLPGRGGDSEEDAPDAGAVMAAMIEAAQVRDVPLADHAIPVVDREYIGVGIDPAAWLARDEDPATAVSRHADRLVSLRLCDLLTSGLRGPIGDAQEGRLDVLAYRVAAGLAAAGRPIVVDARQWSDPWAGLKQTLDAWWSAG